MSETRTNPEWLHDLNSDGSLQETAIADLRDLLLRAALYFFSKNLSDFGGLGRNEILQKAEDCAQEALMAVMQHLADFRGDSKFTTWAYKFAINMALMSARHERMKGVSLDEVVAASEGPLAEALWQAKSEEANPEQARIREEIREVIKNVIEHELTERQRLVLFMVIFNDVPMDEVVQYLGVNRNAIYKLLHDTRRKLKNSLQRHGFDVPEMLAWFGITR